MKLPLLDSLLRKPQLPEPEEPDGKRLQAAMNILDAANFGILDLPDGRPAVEVSRVPTPEEFQALRYVGMGELPVYIKVTEGSIDQYFRLEDWLKDREDEPPKIPITAPKKGPAQAQDQLFS